MAGRVRLVQQSFAAGEVSPKIFGRTDVDRYQAACETLENFFVMRQGGVTRRPGTMFVAETKDSTVKSVLFPFQFNDQQAYIVEAGNAYFRFYKDSGQVFAATTDAVITNGTFTTDLAGWVLRNAGTGTVAQTAGVARFTANSTGNEARLYQQVLIGASYRTTLHVLRFKASGWTGVGFLGLRIGTTVGGSEIKAFASYANGWHTVAFDPAGNASVYIEFEHNATSTRDLDDVSLFSNQPVELTTPYTTAQVSDIQFDQSADTMWLTHRLQKPRKLLRLGDASWSIVEYTPAADPFTSATNYPRSVALWTSRLWFGGTDTDPRKVWSSQVDDFENLDPGTALDDQGIRRTIAGGRINVVQWFMPGPREMFIGTYGSEMRLKGDVNGVVTPKNTTITPATSHGSLLVKPLVVANSVMFLQRSKKKLRQLVYDLYKDIFEAQELTTAADHITGTGLVRLSYREDPEPIVFGVRLDGQLAGMTFHPTEKLLGWHRHVTQGLFESVATIPHTDGTRDQTWVIVNRTINGVTKRFVEYMDDGSGFYVGLNTDCTLIGNFATPQSAVTGLTHLNGATVQIVGDGAVYPDQVVSGGQVTLDPPAKLVEVGLQYKSKLVTLRPEVPGGSATIQGVSVGRSNITIRVLNVVAIKVNGTTLPDRSSEDPMDAPPALFTGDLDVPTLGWSTDDGKITVEQELPLPCTVLLLAGNVQAGDEP